MRVAVIGAGAAGLACARHLIHSEEGHSCVIFEQTSVLGGTWVYTERVGADEFGYPVHTSMYKNLRTNLPKEVMGFPDFPIKHEEKSYIPASDILKCLQDYADNFTLREYIQFFQHVKKVVPRDGQWDITVVDVRTKEERLLNFDAVMVCNGHYWKPRIPHISGADKFGGAQIHSHDYRSPEIFRGKRVLVIGAGPSGMDLTLEIASEADEVVMSHHNKDSILTVFPSNVVQKPDVTSLMENTAVFEDGTEFPADVILYCTGFLYNFPFLDEKCKVRVENSHVKPLYKHLFHIEFNTLCFIGLPYYVCACLLFDLQAQCVERLLSGRMRLPPMQEMVADGEREAARRREAGLSPHQAHMMGPLQAEYYDELADLAGLPRVPPVMTLLHNESSQRFLDDLLHYREDVYRIIDEKTFVKLNQ